MTSKSKNSGSGNTPSSTSQSPVPAKVPITAMQRIDVHYSRLYGSLLKYAAGKVAKQADLRPHFAQMLESFGTMETAIAQFIATAEGIEAPATSEAETQEIPPLVSEENLPQSLSPEDAH